MSALRRESAGSVAVEFAFIALPMFVLILGNIQVLVISLNQQMLETAAEAISRQILTGTVQKAGLSQSQFVTLACSLLPATMNCNRLIIDVRVATSFSAAVVSKPSLTGIGNPTATTVLNYAPGIQGQIVVLRLLYALPVINLPGLTLQSASSAYGFNFPMATAVFKNETYS